MLFKFRDGDTITEKDISVSSFYALTVLKHSMFLICSICDCMRAVHIHHKDKNRNNNTISNFIVVCRLCHLREHNRLNKDRWI